MSDNLSDKHILTDCLECGAENKVHKMRAADEYLIRCKEE